MLTDDARAVIRRLRDAAESAKPMSHYDVLTQKLAPITQFADIVIDGQTWFCGYGIEVQTFDCLCRHLSVSHPNRVSTPGEHIAKALTEAFGFTKFAIDISIYPKRGFTVHFMERLDET